MTTRSSPSSARVRKGAPFLNETDAKNERSLVPASGLRLAPLSAPLIDRQMMSGALTQDILPALTQWPSAAPPDARKTASARTSKAPLAMQLEAFLRKEYRQYLDEHPDCTRKDTIHIFREGLSAFIDHFSEYSDVLHLIQDEYDATLSEYASELKIMRATELEGKSNRSIHAMELMQMKETLNATISNQQTQLKASEAIIHSLRDQLAAAEHANSSLRFEMEKRLTEHEEAKQKVTLLAKSLIEESARTSAIIEASKQKDHDMELQEARIKVLSENVQELEAYIRENARARVFATPNESDPTAPSLHSPPRPPAQPARTRSDSAGGSDPLQSRGSDAHAPGESAEVQPCQYTDEYVLRLLSRLDALSFQLAQSSGGLHDAENVSGQPCQHHRGSRQDGQCLPAAQQNPQVVGHARYPIIEEWLRQEGVVDQDLEVSEILVPPGLWASEPFAFLGGCQPVRDRHLTLHETRRLLDLFWHTRELERGPRTRLQPFFLGWLRAQTGSSSERVKELGLNLGRSCERFISHPDCRMFLLCLRGYLPDDVALTCRRLLQQVIKACQTRLEYVGGEMPSADFFDILRRHFPEKPRVSMLQLRFCAFRQCDATETLNVDRLLSPNSHFVTLLTQQFCTEVEAFTLAVVEGIRSVSDTVKGTVGLNKAMKVVSALDTGMSEETLHTYFSAATQKPLIDVATADHTVAIKTELLLSRFRTGVLLRRSTPPNLEDI